ncbi:probably inactive receptor-like protein kinase At5g41680 [Bidens hawaiensis]|uniref:probably inactive receptor-like protein kinase At5g41680 n=1 Tax=Bidens hawaiensis TaxID=980011 RepID=UPI00404985C0
MQLLIIQLMLTMLSLVKSTNITIQEFYDEERDALIPFRDSMHSSSNLHGNWTGPPCRNNNSRWIGITCSNSHITELTLESINLTGTLPAGFLQNITYLTKLSFHNNNITGNLPSLTNLTRLKFIFLSGNRFSASIPLDYIYLPSLNALELQENKIMGTIPWFDQESLTNLNLSYNQLSGPIPDSKVLERFNQSSFDHNLGLCGRPLEIPCGVSPPPSPSEDEKKPLKVWSILLIAAAIVIVPLFVILFVFCCYRRVAKKEVTETHQRPTEGVDKKSQWSASTDDPGKTVDLEFFDKQKPVFVLDELLRSSVEVLGKGILGTTYKATLESGSIVAVKRVKEMNSLTKKEFEHQMRLLGKLKHENIVEMISFYYSKEEKLVVHEFIRNGSLFELLHESRGIGRIPLNWTTRLQIMKDVAKGLTFLHQSLPSQKPPHGNLKSSNILIDFTNETARAKLTDFGYLPLVPSQKAKLAIGQCPEVKDGKKPTHKSDVYCFGVVLLEVITGKLTGDDNNGDVSSWVRSVVSSDWSTDIFDLEILAEKEEHEDMLKIAELALECTDVSPERRPDMNQILTRLEDIQHRA